MMAISPQRSLGSGIFKDIKEVPPAYCLTYNENGIKIKTVLGVRSKRTHRRFRSNYKAFKRIISRCNRKTTC